MAGPVGSHSMRSLLSCSFSAADRVTLPSPRESPVAECPRDPVYTTRFVYLCTETRIKCLVFNTLI